jgi:transcriptional regulator with XRE-family HTH domain
LASSIDACQFFIVFKWLSFFRAHLALYNDNVQTIFNNLRVARVAAGLRQIDLARRIGRSTSFVCRLETGGTALLSPGIVETIAEAVKVPAAVLFGAGGERKPTTPPTPLKALLSAEKRTQRYVARALKISEEHMSAIARGVLVPDADLAEKIARVCMRPVAELFPEEKGE